MINSNSPLIVARLVFINRASGSQDRAYDDFNTVLLTELHVNFAVIVSCAPFLKHVMLCLQTGWITTDPRNFRQRESLPADSNRGGSPGHGDLVLHANSGSPGWTDLGEHTRQDAVITTNVRSSGEFSKQDEASEEGMVIKKTTMIAVDFHGRKNSSSCV
jgi:hypothetical protein